jgi:hypothetical protein
MKKRKIFYVVIILLLLLAVGLKFLNWKGEKSFNTLTEKSLDVFHEKDSETTGAVYETQDLSSLPEAVRKYLEKAMPAEGLCIKRVRIRQKGEIRVHDEASWKTFTAVQYVSVNPPKMLWAGDAEHWPMTNLRILTTYLPGGGETSAYLWGLLPAFENRGTEMKAYLMVRWLGEAVWYPTALLPSERVSWEAVESKQAEVSQARVRFTDGDMTVSGIFTFMKSSRAPLMFMVDDGAMPALRIYRWYCTYSGWTRFGDYQVPRKVTEGLINGALREERLKISIASIDFER